MKTFMLLFLMSMLTCNDKDIIERPKTDPVLIKIEAVHKTGETITSQTIIVK